MTDDERWVATIRAGDVAQFAQIVHRYDRRVRATISRVIDDRSRVDEAVQSTFYRAFLSLGELFDASRLEPWLMRIARNVAIDARRRASRQRREQPHGQVPDHVRPENPGWIWEEVERLPVPFREVLELRYRQNLTYGEIAEQLSVPTSTIRGRIYEARRALRRRLDEIE